ncbi:hypothetical protein Rsub_02891 [Raphidocelis subcapitata]|uniref:TOG domain-containing protein n=1 Tax=Raphidocelis subcapitata TaxID=307507 RepID=A0A2V0NQ02_9CHLO|nr:hypothetical protein Rsub_02891 [Raphidocelis subcapitata]|eukprot:GBF89721.1 hypothetical protein Rsub_02891 [Raphidocelis subcapitata]
MAAEAWQRMYALLQQPTKQRLQGLDQLQEHAQNNPMAREQLSSLLDMSGQLLGDNNYKVALRTLQVWEAIVQNEGDGVKPFFTNLLPFVVERLSDNRQDVRQAACNLLLEVLQCQVLRPEVMNDRLARFWAHKHWKVRHGLLQFVAEAVCMLGEAALASRDAADPHAVISQIIKLVEDSESAVRDAAIECLEEVYHVMGEPLIDVVSNHGLRPAQLREIYARLGQAGCEVPASPTAAAATPGGGGGRDAGGQRADQQLGAAAAKATGKASSPAAAARSSTPPPSRGGGRSPTPPRAHAARATTPPPRARSQTPPPARAPRSPTPPRSPAAAAAPPRAAAPRAGPAPRRGGYKDAGGVGVGGELPPAPALAVACERELRSEIDRITSTLAGGTAADWQKRIGAMLRLEGLVNGGAAGFDESFDECVRPLREAVGEQLLDRRSAVSRQACHLLGVLSRAMGPRFDAFAGAMVPHLFKVLVITVQVVADAADACARELVCNHHTAKVVAVVADALAGDKNPKLRQYCATYLSEILEDWSPHEYAHHVDKVEAALTRALGDNLTSTRATARAAFCAYHANAPDRAAALLRRLDGQTQSKLIAAAAEYSRGAATPRADGGSGGGGSGAGSRPASAGGRAGAGARGREAAGAANGDDTAALMPPPRAPAGEPSSRKPAAPSGPPLRVAGGGAPAEHPPQREAPAPAAAGAPHRSALGAPVARQHAANGGGGGGAAAISRASSVASDDLRLDQLNHIGAGLPGHAAPYAPPGATAAQPAAAGGHLTPRGAASSAGRAALARAVGAAIGPAKDWQDRVARLDALGDALIAQAEAGYGAAEVSEVERALPKLMDALDDGHFKISLAALGTVQAAIRAAPRAAEPCLDKLMPLLFLKLCAPKETMRGAAEAALQACALQFTADELLPALNRSLDAVKQPAARVSVMEFSVLFVGEGKVAGVPAANMHLRQWVARTLPLLLDKNAGVRRMAARALAALHATDAPFVASCLQHASGQEVVAFERAMATPGLLEPHSRGGSPTGDASRPESVCSDGEAAATAPAAGANGAGGGGGLGFASAGQQHHHQQQQQQQQAWQAPRPGPAGAVPAVYSGSSSYALPRSAAALPPAAPSSAAAAALTPRDGGGGVVGGGGAGAVQQDVLGRTFLAPPPGPAQPIRVDLPSDPAAQSRHLSLLVARLQSRPGEDVLAELAACAEAMGQEAWDASFSKVLLAALAATKHASERVREAAFGLLRQLAAHQAGQFGPVLDVVMQPLLLGCADPSREVLMAAHQALEALIDATPPAATLEVLRLKLPSGDAVHSGTAVDGDVLCAAIRCVQRAAARLPPAELSALAPAALLPGLFAAFQHPRPDVRKVVVFCLVDVWMHVGDSLTPYLSSLSTSQLKLLTIYFTRAQETLAAQRRREQQ